jgi:cell division protein FtsL
MKKFLFYTLFLIFASYFLVNTLRTLYHLYTVEQKMGESKQELLGLEKENNELKSKLNEVNSPYYLEKEGRDKFLLKKPNEEVLVIQSPESLEESKTHSKYTLPNWKKWYNLLLKR